MKIGTIKQSVISVLNLDILPDTPIFIGESNIVHMKQKHFEDYEKYGEYISDIVNDPDYVGINFKDGSIEYVKEFKIDNEYVKVAIRVSTTGVYYARSIYVLNNNRVRNYIEKGTLKSLDK